MKKQIALVLAATLLVGSAPGWTADAAASTRRSPGDDHAVRDSIGAAVARVLDRNTSTPTAAVATPPATTSGPALTAEERSALATRHDALQTDPVARGGGQAVMLLLGAAASIGGSIYLIHELNKNKSTTQFAPAGGRVR